MKCAALFVRSDSIYKTMPDVDCYDIDRDARSYLGNLPVVAHPPCRAWGRLRQFAKPRPDEKELAFFAIEQVRKCGGVLEHPEHSSLWKEAGLPLLGEKPDQYGGWTYPVDQFWFGHLARKRTWLYICGPAPREIPAIPLRFGEPQYVVRYYDNEVRKARGLKILSKADREHTPEEFAKWLCQVAAGK